MVFQSYVNARWIYGDHVWVNSLVRETRLSFKGGGVIASTMVSNEEGLWRLSVIIGRQMNSVVASSSAAFEMEISCLADKAVRVSAARGRSLLNSSCVDPGEQAGGGYNRAKRL